MVNISIKAGLYAQVAHLLRHVAHIPLSPDLIRDVHDQSNLLPLLCFAQAVALFRRGKTTLRTEANLIEADVLGRFL